MPRLLTLARAALVSAILLSTTSALATQVLLLSPEQMGSDADVVLRRVVEPRDGGYDRAVKDGLIVQGSSDGDGIPARWRQ